MKLTLDADTFYDQTARAIAGYVRQELRLQPGVHYQFTGAIDGPHVLTIVMSVNPRHAAPLCRLAEPLSMAARLDRGVSIRIDRGRHGLLYFEVPKPGGIGRDGRPWGLHYSLPASSLPRRRFMLASVGFTNEFRPAGIDFASPMTPHCLVAGTTGSGKTNAMRLIVLDLARQNQPEELGMILIQTIKGGAAWRPFERLPHLAYPVIADDATAWKVLAWVVAEISQRGREQRTTPRLLVAIDELQALLEQPHFVKPIVDLAATGREAGIHLLGATQNPVAEQLKDLTIKRNMSVRLVGRVDGTDAARAATGQANSMAHTLCGGGDMLLVQPGQMRRIATALVGERDLERLPRVEEVAQRLDLAGFEDLARLPDVPAGRADPVEPDQVALALTPAQGINKLQKALNCGPAKAQRVREFADGVQRRLAELGYAVGPILPDLR
jgi:hypothetical protein